MKKLTSKKAKLKSDSGMTLVELIIVIAIIAVLTGISFVTVTMISSARAKEASVEFESQLSDMVTKSKNQVCVVSGVVQPTYSKCMMFYQDANDKYYIKTGYYNPNGADDATKYIFLDAENGSEGKGKGLSSKVTVAYKGADGVEKTISNSGDGGTTVESVYIVYDRDGRCIQGNGTFSFYKKNGNAIADVTIQKNGSHQSN